MEWSDLRLELLLSSYEDNYIAGLLVINTLLVLSQHDIPESLLRGALDGVVEDCVSFVGVDLNVAGVSMLR